MARRLFDRGALTELLREGLNEGDERAVFAQVARLPARG